MKEVNKKPQSTVGGAKKSWFTKVESPLWELYTLIQRNKYYLFVISITTILTLNLINGLTCFFCLFFFSTVASCKEAAFPSIRGDTRSGRPSVFCVCLASSTSLRKLSLVQRGWCQAEGLPITSSSERTARRHSLGHVVLIIRDSLRQKSLLGFDTPPVGGVNKSSEHA